MGCNQKGNNILNEVGMTLYHTKLSDIFGIFDDEVGDYRPLTQEELDTQFVSCNKIQVNMLGLSMFDPTVRTDIEAYPEYEEDTVTVKANKFSYVTVRDVIQAFLNHNAKIAAFGELVFDHVYYEGIDRVGDDLFSMTNFGS